MADIAEAYKLKIEKVYLETKEQGWAWTRKGANFS